MTYWKGLFYAAVLDALWLTGCPSRITGPERAAREPSVQEVLDLDRGIDELMAHLQEHPDDVAAMQRLADLYARQGWHEQAIGPLARALQLDASRRGLWVALDDAVAKSGRAKITDAELARLANEFQELVEMWGHGC